MNNDLFVPRKHFNGFDYIDYSTVNAELSYFADFFDKQQSENYFQALFNEIDWDQEWIRLYGKTYKVPRLSSWHGDAKKSYTYSGIRTEPKPWNEVLTTIKQQIEQVAPVIFNSVLVNRYRDGNDGVAWHSDDEPELGVNPVIASVSFGAVRAFQLTHKQQPKQRLDIDLESGSLLLMQGQTQHYWKHRIAKTKQVLGERINLTFRVINN